MFEKWLKSRNPKLSTPMGRAVASASVIGLHMVIAVFIGFGIGYFLDRFFGTTPWLMVVFLLLGVIAGFKNMVSQGKKLFAFHEKIEEDERQEK